MLDHRPTYSNYSKSMVTMSRKRTRSHSEDLSYDVAHIQPVNTSFCKPAPFSDDPEAIKIRNECDYTRKITLEMARNGQATRPIRIYADGVYDLFHQGHARQLKQAKSAFSNVHLIVGVCSDALTRKMKGLTVLTEDERYDAVRHCRYVDEIVKNAPWEYKDDFLTHHKIDFVAHDDIPYATDDTDDIYKPLKDKGMFLATQRTEGVSTSDVVARIVRDYDVYVRRNVARGYSAKELNISFLKEKKIKLQNKMHNLKDKGKQIIDTIGECTDDIITKWEEKSREFIDNFLMLFEKERLVHIWNESKDKILHVLTPSGSPTRSSESPDENNYDFDYGPSPPKKLKRYNSLPRIY